MDESVVVAHTRAWVLRSVIGLNLCPFARAPLGNNRVRFAVSRATEPQALRRDLRIQMDALAAADPQDLETTLLIHPWVHADFLDFNDFLDVADEMLCELGYEGVLQVASFHPDYCFAGAAPDDLENATNRSPYPTLHLLREDSIERAVQAIADPRSIFEANIDTLRELGPEGWAELQAQCAADAAARTT